MKPRHDVLTHMKHTSNRGGPVGGGKAYWDSIREIYRPASTVQLGERTDRTVITKLPPAPLWEIEEEDRRTKKPRWF